MNKLIYFAPRVLALAAILFISMFALDAFAPGLSLGEALIGFAMHMIPSVVLLVMLVIGWRFEWLGALLFGAAGLSGFFLVHGPWWSAVIIGGPFILTGILFGVSAIWAGK